MSVKIYFRAPLDIATGSLFTYIGIDIIFDKFKDYFSPYLTACSVRYGEHNVKNVRIRSYSGPHFPTFGLNTERFE